MMEKQQVLMKSMYAKSKSLSIPYENLLAGCAQELVIEQLFLDKEKVNFALANDSYLGMSYYQKGLAKKISLRYFEKEESSNSIMDVLGATFHETKIELISEQLIDKNGELRVVVKVPIERLIIEIELELKPALLGKSYGSRESIQSILGNNRKLAYFRYAREGEIAEKIDQCLYYMELIPDMESYSELFYLLEKDVLQGRKVRDCLHKINTKGIYDRERRQEYLSYSNNKELEERWMSYSKRMKMTELTWKAVIEKCNRFIQPIVKSLEEDELFFGDWMPELERFM